MVTLFTTVILLLASLDIAVCQRKVSRNVAVASEVKTVVNFNCPEEFGYYPHPSDCTQYYVCVFGGALLESCTGGLMYSHELQTCDWPRNVGCDGAEIQGPVSVSATSASPPSRTREEPRTRYTPPTPPPPQPAAIVTSRGQPRQLHHNQQEIIKQRQQLYTDVEETLPPAEEIESDRQQRVYRGQPSTVGQVQKDRDGIRHSNAIQSYSGRGGDRIGVISFGTQQQQYRVEQSSPPPVQPASISTATATARSLYNSSQYNNNYDPYYTLYDDDVELYRDVDYSQQYNNNNNAAQSQSQQQSYRRTPSPAVQSTQEEPPKRGHSAYIQNNYSAQDIYQPSTGTDYNEDNSYNSQVDDQNSYRQINRQPTRGDRNDLNYFEEAATKRTTTTTTTRKTTTRTTTSRTFPPKKSTVPSTTVPNPPDTRSEKSQKSLKSVRKLISPINVNYGLSSVTESSFESAEKLVPEVENVRNILPYRRSQTVETRLTADYADESTTKIAKPSTSVENLAASSIPITQIVPGLKKTIDDYYVDDDFGSRETKLRHYIEPLTNDRNGTKRFRTTIEIPPPYDLIEESSPSKPEPDLSPDYKLQPFPKPVTTTTTTKTTTTKTVDSSYNTSIPARVSRVNTAIKSQIAFGGTRRQNVKCHESADSKCNDPKHQRTSTRGRGSTHYSNGANIVNNEVTVTVNRGTPASRPRPTLKPSTSIVSKASEFIDIYRYPPLRPDPIYPQPQPDKTAAKCRKDVCLLPDCYCGGKEIPGDLPVEQVPQIVLLTYDDSVNDLNKGLYSDLFEKGRVNPNGCPIAATFYVSHEWTDYSQVQNLYSDGHEIASHTVSHSFGEQFSQKKWTREVAGQREILSAYGGVHLEDVRGMRAPFLSVGGNKMFKMLYDSNFTYDSSMPIYENKPPSWPYTLDYKLFHDCMIPPCPTRSYPGVWEVPMVMWQDLNGGRCSMGDACSNPPDSEGVFKMLTKNFQRHYTTNRAPFGLFYHAAWFTQPHHKEGFINFLDSILQMKDVWLVTNWQAIQWIRDPTPNSRLGSFQPFQCEYSGRPKRCNNPKVCNLWHKSGVRYMRTCQPCPDIYPWTGNSGIRSSRIDNDIED